MPRSTLQQKIYKRNRAILDSLATDKTKMLARKLRKSVHIDPNGLLFLIGLKSDNRRKSIDILLNDKIRKAFNKFWEQVNLNAGLYSYLLQTNEAKYFMAELFFFDTVLPETLETTNLLGIEWIDHKQHNGDNSLYLKIVPGTNKEALDTFFSLAQNDLSTVFQSKKNIPHLQPNLRAKNEAVKSLGSDIMKLNSLTSSELMELLKTFNPEAAKGAKWIIKKYGLISLCLYHGEDFHSLNNKPYSEGYIKSVIGKNPSKTKRAKK